ncbi:D-alanyl-D-alanine carboxypeptidase/D-alanyl-D-alanine endopeptidase [Corynebacterium pseudopelargi]|uniref:D-alanyl-D-alanine carboxypeptidase DacB n=1 Tax=Corynebacterium pseudopelargi TaxID=2080757 RepID=A0A3G6IWW3_9CORY|nr:D-alanyl-D-alanine carboxypeptidase/D-alanyl-D-alanine-endopeptidase [Corynebacterium pseudopelargi]AZA08444.1 D-alanyl-D-alanine carboxypeptidase DacB precursor [Corynebacterium pseudopelargi]
MKKAQWWTSLLTAGVVVALTAGAGLWISQQNALQVDPPAQIAAPQAAMETLGSPAELNLNSQVAKLAQDSALGSFGLSIVDVSTGEVLFESNAQEAMVPASSTKMLTAAAALLKLGPDDVIETKVLKTGEDSIVIEGSGDVWFNTERIVALATQIQQQMPTVNSVLVDTSAWPGEKILPGWNPEDIDGGYVAPLESLMINQGRVGASSGDVPRSHNPALDVAKTLAQTLGAGTFGYTDAAEGEVIATSQSPALDTRISAMMEDSDNVMAEAIARELDPAAPQAATLEVLSEAGMDISGVQLVDNCGLSLDNRIPARLLSQIATEAAGGEQLRPLLATLPIAGANGTLADRFGGLDGRGWVRAKTGTLTKVAALAGVVPSESGHMISFGMISNGADVDGARRKMDEIASALRDS